MAKKMKATKGRDDRWRVHARAFLFQNPVTGKQSIAFQTIYGATEREALTAAEAWVADQRKSFVETKKLPQKACKDTLAVYGRKWLDSRKPAGNDTDRIKRSTWEGYDALFHTYIEAPKDPYLRLGYVPVSEVTAVDVKEFYKTLGSKARALHAVLRQIFEDALTMEATKKPLREQLRGHFGRRKTRRPVAYTEEQLTAFLHAANTDRYRAFWYLFAFTGMRPSELLALTVKDVDLDSLTVHVSKRLRRLSERSRADIEVGFEMDEPKTENSIHDVALSPELLPILQQRLDTMKTPGKARLRGCRCQLPDGSNKVYDLLFTTQNGEPVDWANMRASYRRICKRANLGITVLPVKGKDAGQCTSFKPLLKPYALRHTHATLSLADGVPIEVISERLGHYKTSFTMDTYVGKQTGRQKIATAAWSQRAKRLTGTTN